MINIESLIETIVLPLLDHPNEFSISIVDTDEFTEYHLNLNPEDIGRVIGKKGRVARAIRTIVYSVKTPNRKRSRIVIPDHAESAEIESE